MMPRWKKRQKERRFKKQKRLILGLFFLLLLLLILASIFRFYSVWHQAKLRDLKRINIILESGPIFLVSFERDKSLYLIQLPAEQKITLSRGFGDYPLKVIYQLGELSQKGNELLAESVQNYFSLPIWGTIIAKDQCDWQADSVKKCLTQILWSALESQTKTNLNFFDLFDLWQQVKKIPTYDCLTQDLAKAPVFLPNGEFALPKLDAFWGKSFFDQELVRENLAVAIFNTTAVTGLGNQAGRLLVNAGGHLIEVSNAESEQAKTILVANKKTTGSYTYKFLQQIFQAVGKEGEIEGGRAEIAVYLGTDYWKRLNEKW